jgi:hypothetical protein
MMKTMMILNKLFAHEFSVCPDFLPSQLPIGEWHGKRAQEKPHPCVRKCAKFAQMLPVRDPLRRRDVLLVAWQIKEVFRHAWQTMLSKLVRG